MPIELSIFPPMNAVFNSLCAFFLIMGILFIKKGDKLNHRRCMLIATALSVFFLAGYLYYHFHHGSQKFAGQGWIRPVYFGILISHTVLAIVNLPMIITTEFFAWRGLFDQHKKLARWTFPIWLYVSVTGVLIYLMLYVIFR